LLYFFLETVCYTFFWDKLPVKKKELTLKVFNKFSAKVRLEWIEGVFINPPPAEIVKRKIPVFGIVKLEVARGEGGESGKGFNLIP